MANIYSVLLKADSADLVKAEEKARALRKEVNDLRKAAREKEKQFKANAKAVKEFSVSTVALGVALGELAVKGVTSAIGGVTKLVTGVYDAALQLDALSDGLKISTKELSIMYSNANRAGMSITDLSGVLENLYKRFSETTDASSEVSIALRELGIVRPDNMTNEWLVTLMKRIDNISDSAVKAKFQTIFFGKAGIAAGKQFADYIETSAGAQAQLTQKQIDDADRLSKAWNALTNETISFRAAIMEGLVTAANILIPKIDTLVKSWEAMGAEGQKIIMLDIAGWALNSAAALLEAAAAFLDMINSARSFKHTFDDFMNRGDLPDLKEQERSVTYEIRLLEASGPKVKDYDAKIAAKRKELSEIQEKIKAIEDTRKPIDLSATQASIKQMRETAASIQQSAKAVVPGTSGAPVPVTVTNAKDFNSAGIDNILDAVRMVESGGGKHLYGPKTEYGQALGPYQILDKTAAKAGINPMDEGQARGWAKAYLERLYKRYGNWEHALMAYHAGEGNMDAFLAGRRSGVGPLTKSYPGKVLKRLNGGKGSATSTGHSSSNSSTNGAGTPAGPQPRDPAMLGEAKRALDGIVKSREDIIRSIELENSLLGKTAEEQRRINIHAQLEADYRNQSRTLLDKYGMDALEQVTALHNELERSIEEVGAALDTVNPNLERYYEGLDAIRQEAQNSLTPMQQYVIYLSQMNDLLARGEIDSSFAEKSLRSKRMELGVGTFDDGITAGIDGYLATISDHAKLVENYVSGVGKSMEDALVGWMKTGKLDWQSFLSSIVEGLIRIYVQLSIMEPLMKSMKSWSGGGGSFGGLFGGLFGGGGTGIATAGMDGGGVGNLASGAFSIGMLANGGVLGRPNYAANGTVLTGPTYFPKFNTIGGEAGDEGLLPLRRMGNGKLGVHASGNGSNQVQSIDASVVVNVTGAQDPEETARKVREATEQQRRMIVQVLAENQRPGGVLNRTGAFA